MCLHLEHPHAICELLCDLHGVKCSKLRKGNPPLLLFWSWFVATAYHGSQAMVEEFFFAKRTIVDTDCVAVVRTDISYVTITPITELSRPRVE